MLLFSLRPATISGIDQGTIMSRKSRSSSVLCRVVSRHPIFTRAFMKKTPRTRPIVGGNWKCNPAKLGDAKALTLTFQVIGKFVHEVCQGLYIIIVSFFKFSNGNQSDLIESCETLGKN